MVQNRILLRDVHVEPDHLLGAAGKGEEASQNAMMFARLVIGAMSVGGMKRCAQLMIRYASRRSIATGRLLENPVTLTRLSGLAAAITSVETLVGRVAEMLDAGRQVPEEAYLVCKTSGPEFLWQAADDLVQLLGGRGYSENNLAPQLLRDARLFRVFEGPTETLTMHLGSRLINQPAEAYEFLRKELGVASVADRLQSAVEQIQTPDGSAQALFADQTQARQWIYSAAGQIGTQAFLWAVVQHAHQSGPSPALERALCWAKFVFERTLTNTLEAGATKPLLLAADELSAVLSNYQDAIGDVEQTLAGEDQDLDPMLRRELEKPHQIPIAETHPAAGREFPELQSCLAAMNPPPSPPRRGASFAAPLAGSPPGRGEGVGSWAVTHVQGEGDLAIQNWLVQSVAKKARVKPESIDVTKPFTFYGLDSVIAVELSQDLSDWLKRNLPATLLWNYPTIQSLAHFLSGPADETSADVKADASKGRSSTGTHRHHAMTSGADLEAKPKNLEKLSEDDVAALLAKELAAGKQRKTG